MRNNKRRWKKIPKDGLWKKITDYPKFSSSWTAENKLEIKGLKTRKQDLQRENIKKTWAFNLVLAAFMKNWN